MLVSDTLTLDSKNEVRSDTFFKLLIEKRLIVLSREILKFNR